jgi:ABC-2 type transport system ATP-binding protein
MDREPDGETAFRRQPVVRVEHLTKYYGVTTGIKDLTFQVEKGEILGFLGPNGAGKTTTLKILTCYLPPTSGYAQVCGFNILDDPMEVRRRIGYLPEKNPLYPEMEVTEYLGFVARMKGVPSGRIGAEIDRTIEMCGLREVHRRMIGKLSKGYQQRVGIGQAILNEPELLILDEPTLGLDPKQIRDIRKLIQELGSERTVILSSHILPEVNEVCNRVIIINRGELVAVDTPENLRSRLKKSSVTCVKLRNVGNAERARDVVSGLDGLLSVREGSIDGPAITLLVESAPDRDLRQEIVTRLVEAKMPVLEIYNQELSLEDIFLQLVVEEVD